MKLEHLSKLTVHAVNLVGGSGGRAELTSAENGAFLAGLSPDATRFARYRYLLDKSVQPAIFYRAYLLAADEYARHGWEVPRGEEIIRSLTRVALAELVDQPVCPDCGGAPVASPVNPSAICEGCDGLGRVLFTDGMIARIIRRDKANYSRVWRHRYLAIRAALKRWIDGLEGDLIEVLRKI